MYYKNIKYLDPKNDLTFRKIFGQHPHIMKSFLNSVLKLKGKHCIEKLIYDDPALIPEIPELKHSIVDVRCTDKSGRNFIVEMQMYWSSSFKNRMLFNAGKAYVKQLDKGHRYSELQPVYGISLVNEDFMNKKEHDKIFYHNFKIAHEKFPNEIIKGIELIFVELPKFKKLKDESVKNEYLWLRFLTEIDEKTKTVSEDLIKKKEIKDALEHLNISAFSKAELAYYDKYWDKISTEKTALHDKEMEKQAVIKERNKLQKEKDKVQKEKEKAQKRFFLAVKKMYKRGFTVAEISDDFDITKIEINKILEN